MGLKMRRKKLQGTANVITQMFCGWRLVNSYKELAKLKTGVLTYDLASQIACFDGVEILPIMICHEIRCFWQEDLARNKVLPEALSSARVRAILKYDIIDSSQRRSGVVHLDKNRHPINGGKFHRCIIKCMCALTTAEKEYVGNTESVAEWPINWP